MNSEDPKIKASKLIVNALTIFGTLSVTFGFYLLGDPTRQTLAIIAIGVGLLDLGIAYRTHMKMYSE